MFMHGFQTKVRRALRADWLFQMNKQAHTCRFYTTPSWIRKEGRFCDHVANTGGRKCKWHKQYDLSILKPVVEAMIAAAAQHIWEARAHAAFGESIPVMHETNGKAECRRSISSPVKQKKMAALVHHWLSRWLSAYHFISHNASGACPPTAGCRSMRRRSSRVVICKQRIRRTPLTGALIMHSGCPSLLCSSSVSSKKKARYFHVKIQHHSQCNSILLGNLHF